MKNEETCGPIFKKWTLHLLPNPCLKAPELETNTLRTFSMLHHLHPTRWRPLDISQISRVHGGYINVHRDSKTTCSLLVVPHCIVHGLINIFEDHPGWPRTHQPRRSKQLCPWPASHHSGSWADRTSLRCFIYAVAKRGLPTLPRLYRRTMWVNLGEPRWTIGECLGVCKSKMGSAVTVAAYSWHPSMQDMAHDLGHPDASFRLCHLASSNPKHGQSLSTKNNALLFRVILYLL